jgi:hypothetical protein
MLVGLPRQARLGVPRVGVSAAEVFPAVHALALCGTLKQLPGDSAKLEAAGLVRSTSDGFMLTAVGHSRHRALLAHERATIDIQLLGIVYERFPDVARRLTKLESSLHGVDGSPPKRLVEELGTIIDALEGILLRSADAAPRFAGYITRLQEARRQVVEGHFDYAFGLQVESAATVVRELHEDYLQTLGRGYEEEELP